MGEGWRGGVEGRGERGTLGEGENYHLTSTKPIHNF